MKETIAINFHLNILNNCHSCEEITLPAKRLSFLWRYCHSCEGRNLILIYM